MQERELERGLLEHLRSLILELGKGFAFVGSQYPLQVGGFAFRDCTSIARTPEPSWNRVAQS